MKLESRGPVRRAGLALLALGLAVSAAACSSASGDTSGSSSTGTVNLSSFESVVSKAEQPWTTWEGPTTPVTPPQHEKLALVTCSGTVNGCVVPAEAAQKAAKSLGWQTTMYDGNGDPVTQDQVVTQAVNSGATAILLSGIDPSVIQSGLAAAAAKKIPVGSMTEGIAAGDGVAFDVGANYVTTGDVAGSWIVAASKGKAVVLPTNDKEFKSTVELVDGAIDTVKKCSTCKVLPTDYFVSSDIGNGLGQQVAGNLQRNPTVNYVIGAYDPAVADMVPAIQNAGLASRVQIISDVGDPQNLGYIKDGNVQAADLVFDNTYVGYAAVDQIIRLLAHKPLWKDPGVTDPRFIYNENVPYHLITKSNVGNPNTPWTESVNTVAQFDKLWGVK